jgi:hypothetical protein
MTLKRKNLFTKNPNVSKMGTNNNSTETKEDVPPEDSVDANQEFTDFGNDDNSLPEVMCRVVPIVSWKNRI